MEPKKPKGGARLGAGRKPLNNKKEPITIYLENNVIYKFGSAENLKAEINQFALNYQKEGPVKVQDLTQPTHQIKPFEQPKGNYTVNTDSGQIEPLTASYEIHKAELTAATSSTELHAAWKRVEANKSLVSWQVRQLNGIKGLQQTKIDF